jgi:hypothetical protein
MRANKKKDGNCPLLTEQQKSTWQATRRRTNEEVGSLARQRRNISKRLSDQTAPAFRDCFNLRTACWFSASARVQKIEKKTRGKWAAMPILD